MVKMVIGVYDILWKEIGGGGRGERRSYIIYMAALLLSPSSGMPDRILSLRATKTHPTSSSSMIISATLVADLDDYPSNQYWLKHVLLEHVYNWVLM